MSRWNDIAKEIWGNRINTLPTLAELLADPRLHPGPSHRSTVERFIDRAFPNHGCADRLYLNLLDEDDYTRCFTSDLYGFGNIALAIQEDADDPGPCADDLAGLRWIQKLSERSGASKYVVAGAP